MKYIPELDGVRAVSVLAVVAFHSQVPNVGGGFVGVDIFFVLSGFLITTLLLSEVSTSGNINIFRFYVFRLLRLMPPLLLLLLVYLACAYFLWPDYGGHLRDTLIVATYLSDYGVALFGMPEILRHTWSLSVEEHFYIIWPIVLLALLGLGSKRSLLLILILFYLCAVWWRNYMFSAGHSWTMVYFRFDTRMSGMVLGAILAVFIAMPKCSQLKVPYALYLMSIAYIGYSFSSARWGDPLSLQLNILGSEIAAALLILGVVKGDRFTSWLGERPLVYLGKLSYGIYLFHYPVAYYLRDHFDWRITFFLAFFLAFLMACFSYHFVEVYFRRLKKDASRSFSLRPVSRDGGA